MRTLLGLLLASCCCTPAQATLVQNFNFATGGTMGVQRPDDSIWDFTITGLVERGTTFDAVVTVDGASVFGNDRVNRTSQGLDTGSATGMQLFDSLGLSLAINNVSGGTISSASFTSALLNNTNGVQQNALFGDGGRFATVDVAANAAAVMVNFDDPHTAFSLNGSAFTTNPGFFLQGITLQITATPEPASMAMMGLAAVIFTGVGFGRRRLSNRMVKFNP